MKKTLLLGVLGLLASCGAVKVDYDYDRGTNFSNYTTYNYFSDMNSGLSQLDERRLLRVLDSTLTTKGFKLSEEPDFFINILSNEYRRNSVNNVGLGVGGTGGNVGGGLSVGIPISSGGLQRMIQFDFVDADRDALFWQAVSDSGYRDNASPSVREDMLRAVVAKVFSKYPPEKK